MRHGPSARCHAQGELRTSSRDRLACTLLPRTGVRDRGDCLEGQKPLCAVLVDDEPAALRRLQRLLQRHAKEIQVVGTASDGQAAIALLDQQKPDVAFMDIGLPDMNGFQALRAAAEEPFVVFTTAASDHALSAFRTNAVDYLVKPVDEAQLAEAVAKLKRRTAHASASLPPEVFQALARLGTSYLSRLQCSERGRTRLISVQDVMFLQSDTKLTAAHTPEGVHLLDRSLVDLEAQLDPSAFIRIHRSTLVNVAWVREYRRDEDGRLCVVLSDPSHSELHVSRSYADRLRML